MNAGAGNEAAVIGHPDWFQANQGVVSAHLDRIAKLIQGRSRSPMGENAETGDADKPAMPEGPSTLDNLVDVFGLSPFERDVLLLCAGMELDGAFAQALGGHESGQKRFPNFSMALSLLPEAHWSALSPEGPLRHWHLLELRQAESLTTANLAVDERILHYLAGINYLDARLAPILEPLRPAPVLSREQRGMAQRLAESWLRPEGGKHVLWQLCGEDLQAKLDVAVEASSQLGLRLYRLPSAHLPASAVERDNLLTLWHRECLLMPVALILDCQDLEGAEAMRIAQACLENLSGVALLCSREGVSTGRRASLRMDFPKPEADEQMDLWRQIMRPSALAALNGQLENALQHFQLSAAGIQAASLDFHRETENRADDQDLGSILWQACRKQSRPRLDGLGQRIEAGAEWQDLVLPAAQKHTLMEMRAQLRHRGKVYGDWGFGRRSDRGLGISALFSGPSGTGKTMAAEVLAKELRLDLYRIDLSCMVSKYIGETEKNLRKVFDAAEEAGAILLFDEADALFGKRSEVKDSHDRYANLEVSYLLQRMETYRGLAILTTNMKSALDAAFLRRIKFVIQFPFPDLVHREEIWKRVFPAKAPLDGLDYAKLARLNLTGGNIRNMALNAAFLAADANESLGMRHLAKAARSEYAKLEKPLPDSELAGWV